jgi:hypothetical protein
MARLHVWHESAPPRAQSAARELRSPRLPLALTGATHPPEIPTQAILQLEHIAT